MDDTTPTIKEPGAPQEPIVATYNVAVTVRNPDPSQPLESLTLDELSAAIGDGIARAYWDREPGGASVIVRATGERTDI